jgi:hypothetical protein
MKVTNLQPELMIPVTISPNELDNQKEICDRVHKEVKQNNGC